MPALKPQQREQLEKWLASAGELYVDIYRPHSGGSGIAYFVRSVDDQEVLVAQQPAEFVVTVFRHLQYPLRGVATIDLLTRALTEVRDGQWFTIVSLDDSYPTPCTWLGSGSSQRELRDAFSKISGRMIGIGQDPFDECPEQVYKGDEEVFILRENARVT